MVSMLTLVRRDSSPIDRAAGCSGGVEGMEDFS
jgi:hypothetical protein